MNRRFFIKGLRVVNNIRVEYDYEYDSSLMKYFTKKEIFFIEYDNNISDVPCSILAIPLLANILPISWFAGFEVFIDELDRNFFSAQEQIKKEFQKLYLELKRKSSGLIVKTQIENSISGEKTALLFSGGIDAYTTYFRHYDEKPDLITIIGADIPLMDFKQQDRVIKLNAEEKILEHNNKYIIKSNLRDFYTYHVDLMLPSLSWWGEVQHGMALIGSTAPLAYRNRYSRIYIASTHTEKIQISWGSAPYIDNHMKWADIEVVHDGYELERIEKIDYIVQKSKQLNFRPKLRVCYSEINNSINCSVCEKCVRSAFGIMLANDDPNLYGFDVDIKIFNRIIKILSGSVATQGILHHWQQLTWKLKKSSSDVYLFGSDRSAQEIQKILNANTSNMLQTGKKKGRLLKRLKFILINKFPKEFDLYLKIRQNRI